MGNPIIEFKQRENDELKTTGGEITKNLNLYLQAKSWSNISPF